jgi:hypothetical protein
MSYFLYRNNLKIYFVSAAAWAFIFFRKKTKQKKLHPANSHTQNSLSQCLNKRDVIAENFDCVQTVLGDIMKHLVIFLTIVIYPKISSFALLMALVNPSASLPPAVAK